MQMYNWWANASNKDDVIVSVIAHQSITFQECTQYYFESVQV